MIAGPDAVMAVRRILRRQIAVIAQHLAQFAERRRGGDMAYLAADRINRQRCCLDKLADVMPVGQHNAGMARLLAISKTQIPAFCPAERFHLVGIMRRQPARLRQGNDRRGQFSRTQPAAERVLNAPTPGFYASGVRHLLRTDRAGNLFRQAQRQHLRDLLLALLIPAELCHATPVVVECHWQRVVQAAGEGKGRGEKLEQGRIVCA